MANLEGTATVTFEQVTERHDPNPHDKDTEFVDLPGMVDVYLNFPGGGRILLTQYKAGKVLAAIEAAKSSKASK